MTGRVFVVQESLRRDFNGNLVHDKDISAASQYGEMITLVPARPIRGAQFYYDEMRTTLADFDDDDYLLLIGSPEYIAAAGALAADANDGRFKVLRWLRRGRQPNRDGMLPGNDTGSGYIPVEIKVWESDDE